ncbi:ParB N-terminal domain-containing protein [Kytococcus sedentarius]|uniref:ParB-like nuclease n=1 Tax=Kytococcus sedentarius (strain ATCC 14392 / DSM 20547 / JCM 11482 / CCUG 33030 / NBRC 15357 / NCTC 11040 / CCM 314 / 541) TaxID=478801 RepID=C7NLQ7_KYTSD|nr:ParB N-terminal domain-containing protein [Kytococcus sedentarius]ACV05723.1 ParB-like nuclease [Kytococcus sedentarius DSM 20547]QQB64139.1 ParB N-terminal domain-containing protein [Kytococcus sedentarius]STX12863.1 ParB/RepB/Spo0J family partition protein [Kytococcus sedentarius]
MSAPAGFIELERTVASIHVGRRHRTELGDIDALAASIDRDGLLQPITITPDGVLVCGARRLAAITQLGWKTVNVWVRSGISDRLGHLLAEQDDNVLHKPLTQLEAAALYRELKQVMAEDAARRQAATRFSAQQQPGEDGAGKFPTPSDQGRASEQAARMIPGASSYKTMDKISDLQHIAADPAQPDELRQQATAALERIDAGNPVQPLYRQIREQVDTARGDRDADLHQLATDALARIKTTTPKRRPARPTPAAGQGEGGPVRYPVRAFVLTWSELADWWTHYDLDQLAAELTGEQIESFLATVDGTSRFAEELRATRDRHRGDHPMPGRGHLRAL